MKIAYIISIILNSIVIGIFLLQVMSEIANKMSNRHYKKYHNFDTIWWYIDHALDPFTF